MDTSYVPMNSSAIPESFYFGYMSFWFVVLVVSVVVQWKIFTKAGQPGWAIFIPIYNLYIFLKIIGRPGWWILLYFIPFVNLVISIINALDLAKVFGRSTVFGIVALWLFPFVGYPMLAFGSSEYVGAEETPASAPAAQPPVQTPTTPAAPTPPPATK